MEKPLSLLTRTTDFVRSGIDHRRSRPTWLTTGLFSATLKRLKKGIFLHFCYFCMRSLLIIQAILGASLVVTILMQNRGSGLGSAFGGDFGGYYTKRGLEKFFLYATIVLAIGFFVLGMVNVRLAV